MKDMLKMVLVLSLICGLSGFTLAAVRQATKGQIEEQVLTYVQGPALGQVFTDYDNNPILDRKKFDTPNGPVTVFPALKEGKLVGVAFETFSGGYGGPVGVMVGLSTDGKTVQGIGITTSKETPGLGARASEEEYRDQFRNQPLEAIALSKDGGKIQVISGATITTTATIAAVAEAVKLFNQLKDQLPTAWGS